MYVQTISWKYLGQGDCLWLGNTNGLLSHITMHINTTKKENEYSIHSNIHGFMVQKVSGLENAKVKAQELLNSYALSIIIS